MGNSSVPKFILRLSKFPEYRGSGLGRFYCNKFHKGLVEGRTTSRLQEVNKTAFEFSYSNYSLLRFYSVQNEFTDVSTECAVFIFRVHGE
jgi:hypothetical protein